MTNYDSDSQSALASYFIRLAPAITTKIFAVQHIEYAINSHINLYKLHYKDSYLKSFYPMNFYNNYAYDEVVLYPEFLTSLLRLGKGMSSYW